MGSVRRWSRHRWFHVMAGGLAGLLIATLLSYTWHRDFSAGAVTLLGSGHGLSAVVSSGSMRVLIVSGDDPIAFANGFKDAHPPTMRRIDVVILTPSATPYLAERAVNLARPQRIMAIETRETAEDAPEFDDPVRDISAPRSIELGTNLMIDIDPGLTTGAPASGWSIAVRSEAATILLVESAPFRVEAGVGLIAVMGDSVPASVAAIAAPVAHAADVAEHASGTHGHLASGEAERIPIEPAAVIVPLRWLPAGGG
jgi:predicted regulator of Ras-like GTPase activity (Roadblock/LC7/MglB family)